MSVFCKKISISIHDPIVAEYLAVARRGTRIARRAAGVTGGDLILNRRSMEDPSPETTQGRAGSHRRRRLNDGGGRL